MPFRQLVVSEDQCLIGEWLLQAPKRELAQVKAESLDRLQVVKSLRVRITAVVFVHGCHLTVASLCPALFSG